MKNWLAVTVTDPAESPSLTGKDTQLAGKYL
jgi:hypothetical protein